MIQNKQEGVLLIGNPVAGSGDRNTFEELIGKIYKRTHSKKATFNFHETSLNDTRETYIDLITIYNPELVIAAGGDGTFNLVAQALLDSSIAMAFVPIGSANSMAEELNIPHDMDKAIETAFNRTSTHLDAIKVRGENLPPTYSFHIADLGLNANLVKKFEESDQRGMVGYFLQSMETFKEHETITYTISCNGHTFYAKAAMVAIANGKQYGTKAVLNPNGEFDDGKFEVCILSPISWVDTVPLTWHFFKGDLKHSNYLHVFSTDEVEIVSMKESPFQCDGEALGKVTSLKANIISNAIVVKTN